MFVNYLLVVTSFLRQIQQQGVINKSVGCASMYEYKINPISDSMFFELSSVHACCLMHPVFIHLSSHNFFGFNLQNLLWKRHFHIAISECSSKTFVLVNFFQLKPILFNTVTSLFFFICHRLVCSLLMMPDAYSV